MVNVAIVGGCRTPFVKAAGAFDAASSLDLGIHVVKAAVKRSGIDPSKLDEIAFGTVLLDPRIPNLAREIVLRSGLPPTIGGNFVSNNCISGLVAANVILEGIKNGRIRAGIAGGVEYMSRPALSLSKSAESFFVDLSRTRKMGDRLMMLSRFRPGFVVPIPPSPKEPSTGLTMGQHCEITAKELRIDRETQDKIALRSHQNALKAQEAGYLAEEIEPLGGVSKDNIIRGDTTLEKLAKLKPVFDKTGQGTLTAGNSSPLTDGASAVCLMSENAAREQSRQVLAFVEAIELAAINPSDGLLMAPALALPRLLARAGLTIDQIDLFEIHEAFAAQVAANMKAWENGWDKYSDARAIGRIPEEKINPNGGSIAIGHPFAATGGRLLLSTANELRRRGKRYGVISVCAAGAMAAAVLVRNPEA